MNTEEKEIFAQLCDIIEESENLSLEVMNHLDLILEKVDTLEDSKQLSNDIDGIRNTIMTTISSMQSQDIHRQKIERIANLVHPENEKFAKAKHISSDDGDQVDDDELAALIAAANG